MPSAGHTGKRTAALPICGDADDLHQRRLPRGNEQAMRRLVQGHPETTLFVAVPSRSASSAEVRSYKVEQTRLLNLGLTNVCLAFASQPGEGLDMEPSPDGNRIVGNLALGNEGSRWRCPPFTAPLQC